ncbi:MAG TPA: hypothetical protein QGF58_12820 [Myxococcota bacterium]|nr:hypothetical protein [Myxococcota bacterium]
MTLPVAFEPYADPGRLRLPWPLLLDGGAPEPLSEHIRGIAESLGSTLLSDNLGRLEAALREGEGTTPRDCVRAAGERMRAQLGLGEGPDQQLAALLEHLIEGLPAEGRLLSYDSGAALALLEEAARQHALPVRRALVAELQSTQQALRSLLAVERAYEDRSGELGGTTGERLDAGALATMVGRRGTLAMPPERRARIRSLIEQLHLCGPAVIVVPGGDEACATAAARFDVAAQELALALGGLRAARLELADAWDPERHEPLLHAFDWRCFGEAEAALLPTIIVVTDADTLASGELGALIRLLASGRPLQILAEVQPSRNPGLAPGEDPLAGHRVELGLLAVSMRQAFVQQSTPARHEHLWEGFRAALGGLRPALHLVASGLLDGETLPIGAWLTASAAVDARALPLFRYDPSAGESWAAAMDVSGNPEPEEDWSTGFTFADYALLDPALAHHFQPDPEGEVATNDGPQSCSDALRLAIADRRRTWRHLRELGGVANEHARQAAAQAREEARRQGESEQAALAEVHGEELARLRVEAAREAIQRLASVLIDGEAAPAVRPPPRAVTAPVVEDEPEPAASEPEPVVEDDDDDEEAWIDSALCTSCNDCLEINPLLFIYDENKQATIGDLAAGTHAELVAAAEKCPAKCIYPGPPPK